MKHRSCLFRSAYCFWVTTG